MGRKICLLDIFTFSLENIYSMENYLLSRLLVRNFLLFSLFSHLSSAPFRFSLRFVNRNFFVSSSLVNFLLLRFFFMCSGDAEILLVRSIHTCFTCAPLVSFFLISHAINRRGVLIPEKKRLCRRIWSILLRVFWSEILWKTWKSLSKA